MSIPGIGHYTAAAIRNFAFNLPTPCLDTNIRRILHRTFVGPERTDGTFPKDDRYLLKIAEEVLEAALAPPSLPNPLSHPSTTPSLFSSSLTMNGHSPLSGEARGRGGEGGRGGEAIESPHDAANWLAALMDFGSLVQTKKNPQWAECPLTIGNLMVTSQESFERRVLPTQNSKLREPGRRIAGRFVPDRIIRGRIVEALRDAPTGLSFHALGRRAAADWSLRLHRAWLQEILRKLAADRLIEERARKFSLAEESA